MGAGANGGGGRAARALRFLLLLVLALAAVEYLFGSILGAYPLKTYLYTPLYNATQPTLRANMIGVNLMTVLKTGERASSPWHRRLPISSDLSQYSAKTPTITKNSSVVVFRNISSKNSTNNINNMTRESYEDTSTPLLFTKLMDGLKNLVTTEEANEKKRSNESDLPLCDEFPPDLGPVNVNKTDMELDMVEKKYPEVHLGGMHAPSNCTARHRVAIIVPFRDRHQHLAIFLNHMHPFLIKQQIDYGIFVVEQTGKHDFNRAKLMNVGFVESQKLREGGWQCFVFHDIDLLPLDTRNMYTCPKQPRHMSASIDVLNNRLPYEDIFGGVSALTREQFTKVNGFSNKYWGWGAEDDDMAYRLKKMNYHIARYKMSIARYAMLEHKKSAPNPKRYQLLSQTSKMFQKDGLTTLEYVVTEVHQHHLYTHIFVNIDERS